MANAQQIHALVDSHFKRDDTRFKAIVLQIAAHETSRSPKTAERLRKLIERTPQTLTPLPMNAQGFLEIRTNLADLSEMALERHVLSDLEKIIRQNQRGEELFAHNLRPSRRLLFLGPPGVGKTMAAGALARSIGLPLFRVSLHTLIGQFMGTTAAHMSTVFETARTVPGVFLFDEFDALAENRGVSDPSGADREMQRSLNSLLLFIEDFDGPGILVGATNLATKIDAAMFRRFDQIVEFGLPTVAQVEAILTFTKVSDRVEAIEVHHELAGLGHADLRWAIDDVLRDHVIDGDTVSTMAVVGALRRRRQARFA